jgi:hypothetical protein
MFNNFITNISITKMKIKTILMSLLLFSINTEATVVTVGDMADADCDFNEIQDAVSSGNSGMEIRVTNQTTYSSIVIDDVDIISLRGGYETCADAAMDNRSIDFTPSQISGNNTSDSIHISYDTMIFNTIEVSGFDIHSGNPSGIDINSSGSTDSLVIFIEDTSVHDNENHGLKVSGQFTRVEFQGEIFNNQSDSIENLRGGGVNCRDATFTLNQDSSINNNSAGLGGGMYTDNCLVTIFAGDNNSLDNLQYGIFNNHAYAYGGGVRFDDSFVLISGSNQQPASISGNSTDGNGGGVYLSQSNFVEIVNTRIDGNSAAELGGGLYAFATGENSNELNMAQAVNGCLYSEICSSLSHNKVTGTGGPHLGGGAIHAYGANVLNINQTLIEGNQSRYGAVYYGRQFNTLNMEGNLIVRNQKDDTEDPAVSLIHTNTSPITNISYTTIANNNALRFYHNHDGSLIDFSMKKSIISDPNIANIFIPIDQSGAHISCSIVHEDSAESLFDTDTLVGDAGLIGNGNYKLKPSSIAIDPLCVENPAPQYEDIRAYNRTTDGIADIGAYEFKTEDDVIFASGLE